MSEPALLLVSVVGGDGDNGDNDDNDGEDNENNILLKTIRLN